MDSLSYTYDQEIECAPSIKFLGLYLDPSLTWTVHVNYVVKKMRAVTVVLSRLRSSLPKKRLLDIYYSLIHSRMSGMNEGTFLSFGGERVGLY